MSEVYSISVNHDLVNSSLYGFTISHENVDSLIHGISIDYSFDLSINIIDASGQVIDSEMQFSQNGVLIESKASDQGFVQFAIPHNGVFQIRAINSDVVMEFEYKGQEVHLNYKILGVSRIYRVKPMVNRNQMVEWSNELTVRL